MNRHRRLISALLSVTLGLTLLPAEAVPPAFTSLAARTAAAQTSYAPFLAASDIPLSGRNTKSVALGDLNGDGALDLVLGNYANPSQVALNDGRGGFGTPSDLPGGGRNTNSVALGDLNGDGSIDIVLGNNGKSQVFLNSGRGGFAPPSDLPIVGSNPSSVALGDLNGDGSLDIVLGNYGTAGQLSQVFLNNGSGSFGAPSDLPGSGRNTYSVALGDLNGDSNVDIVLGNNAQLSQVFLNNGSGGFGASSDLTGSGRNTTSVALGDLNGDGSLDLALGNNAQLSQVFLNNGSGGFGAPSDLIGSGRNTQSVALGDLNGDGSLDLVLGNAGSIVSQVALNNGSGGFGAPSDLIDSGRDIKFVALGDLNGDGSLDLVLGNEFADRSQVALHDESGRFGAPSALPGSGRNTTSVALGDLNGDGSLDLVLGNDTIASQIAFNNGRGVFVLLSDLPASGRATRSVALGDLDNDRDLDIVLGNNSQLSQVFLNNGVGVFSTPSDLVGSGRGTRSAALGDLNGDGSLDLVLGNDNLASQVFLNNGAGGFSAPSDIANSGLNTTSVALGDLNSDGALDLVLGNRGQLSQTFLNLNDGSGGFALPNDLIDSARLTSSVALSDLNGDGALDLILGNENLASQIALNDGRGGFDVFKDIPSSERDTRSIALGDLNSDGSLDLVRGGGLNQVFLNTRSGSLAAPSDLIAFDPNTRGMALGDLNNDGALDIVLGNAIFASQVFIQRNGFARQVVDTPPAISVGQPGLTPAANFYATPEILTTPTISIPFTLADVEGDPVREVRAEYSLDGGGSWLPAIGKTQPLTGELATSPQRIVATTPTTFTLSPGNNVVPLAVTLPQSSRPISLTDLAVTLSISHTDLRWLIPTLRGANNNTAALARFFDLKATGVTRITFRDDGAVRIFESTSPYTSTYQPYEPLANLISGSVGGIWQLEVQNFQADPNSQIGWTLRGQTNAVRDYTFAWDPAASGAFGQSDNVVVRLRAIASSRPQPKRVAGSYPAVGSAWATTKPFRLRSTIAQVNNAASQPVANALVYRLPAGQVRGAEPLIKFLTGEPLPSNPQGYVVSREPLLPGDRLLATQLVSSTAKYDLYYTSALDRSTGLPGYTVTAPGVQTLSVSPAKPLMLFKLSVSIEWDARNDQQFMGQLRRDLQRASELLYDWSNGQAALGTTTIYQAKERWDAPLGPNGEVISPTADIQIYATNRLRPNAGQGGITSRPIGDAASPTISYEPGQVRIGATWNRNGDPGGVVGEDWPRTLAHELGHYAFYLDDNYLGLDNTGRLISVASCRGAMADPYRDDYSEFHPAGADWDANCAQTLSERVSGRSDWETIGNFYNRSLASDGLDFQLSAPTSFDAQPGPVVQAVAFTRLSEVAPTSPATARERLIGLIDSQGQRYLSSPSARAILYSADGARALNLGVPFGDQLTVRGGSDGDKLCVYDNVQQAVGCTTLTDIGTQLVLTTSPSWQPDLQLTPVNSTTLQLAVPSAGVGAPAPATLVGRFFPDDGPPVSLTLTLDGAGWYSGSTPTLTVPALGGLVRVLVPGAEGQREVVADYSLGGSPAPRQKGTGKNKRRAPALSPDGQVILFTDNLTLNAGQFYAFQTVDRLPPAPSWAVPVGFGYRLLASDAALRGQIPQAALAMSYFAADVPLGAEEGLQVYYMPIGGSQWQALETRVDSEENTAATSPPGEGLYALMASLPLVLDESGWNLVFSYPGADQALPAALGGARGLFSLVYGYDDANTVDPWKLYAPDVAQQWAGLVNDLSALRNSESYWFRTTQPVTIPVLPQTNAYLPTARGTLRAPPATYYGSVPISTTETLTVRALVEGNLCGTATTQQRLIDGATRTVYTLNVLANGAGSAQGCGESGLQVILKVSNATEVLRSVTTTWQNEQLTYLDLNETDAPQPTRGLALDQPGWNLVPNYPFASLPVVVALSDIAGGPTLVYGYDAYDRSSPWQLFADRQPGLPTWVSDLTEISRDEHYFIYATAPVTTVVPPNLRPADLGAPPAGFPESPPATFYTVLPSVGASLPLTVRAMIGEVDCGALRRVNLPDGAVGLVVTVASSAEQPGCGDPSVATTISFIVEINGQEYGRSTSIWDSSRVQALSFYRLHLPMLFVSSPLGPADSLPDLEVIGITTLPAEPLAGQPAEVQVTIRNNGAADITRSFWVDLYLNPARAPLAGEGWPALSEFGASWRVYGLRAGATLVLSTLKPNDPLNPDQSYSNFSGFGLAGEASLYAQVDAYGLDGTAEGAIGEADEANNIYGPYLLTISEPAQIGRR